MKSTATEEEMRNETVPYFDTLEELNAYITALAERNHDYGTCVYAISMAATATFNYMAGKLGITGFQASCADLDIVRRTRSINGPFILLRGENMLYPQYDLPAKLQEAMDSWQEWASKEAAKKLQESPDACESVLNHWKKLAGQTK